MPFRVNPREQLSLGIHVSKWILLSAPVAAIVGSACALFLTALDIATELQWNHPGLLYFLPLAGTAIVLLYSWFGKNAEAGNNLIMDEIHEPGGGVPARMAPLILVSTVITHLFGGSAGREGTAVQMGGSIAASAARWFRLSAIDRRTLLMTGIAAGFGGVFGTPVAGAIFALEVLTIGRITHEAILPCLLASIVGDWSCAAWGIRHTDYHQVIETVASMDPALLIKAAVAGAFFGLASVVFAELTHGLQRLFKRSIRWPLMRPAVGGLAIIALVHLLGTRDYLGLGVHSIPGETHGVSILSSFQTDGAAPLSWWWKILFTAVTLASGFKGGEVTPLFFIGATLGNTLATLLGAPIDLFAALGFVAVFAGATNTPIACTVMGLELFGADHALYIATACSFAYMFSGHSGIYLSQRIGTPKVNGAGILPETSLRERREATPEISELLVRRTRVVREQLETTVGGFMSEDHDVHSREMGQLRIYLAHGDKRGKRFRDRVFGRPLYREIIDVAKKEGLLNATAHSAHYGYTNNGRIHQEAAEYPNPSLSVCVELIAPRDALEAFCKRHASLLHDRILIYKHLEHWSLQATEIVTSDATAEELESDSGPAIAEEPSE